jgi:hypothetical protein
MATKAASKKANKSKATVGQVVDDVLKRRAQALRARAQAVSELSTAVVAATPALAMDAIPSAAIAKLMKAPSTHVALTAAAKKDTKGWLIAEGDSWFDYPGTDILDALEQSAYDVQSVASAGDRIEMMAFGRGQLEKFATAVEKVIC